MRSSITAVIKTSHVITLHYYEKLLNISDIQEIMINDGTFQFTLKNKYGGI
jgi:hypothetical protein